MQLSDLMTWWYTALSTSPAADNGLGEAGIPTTNHMSGEIPAPMVLALVAVVSGSLVLNLLIVPLVLLLLSRHWGQSPPQSPPPTQQLPPQIHYHTLPGGAEPKRAADGRTAAAVTGAPRSRRPSVVYAELLEGADAGDGCLLSVPTSASGSSQMRRRGPIYTAVNTMEEAAAYMCDRNNIVKSLTPRSVLEELKAGNSRFWTASPSRQDLSLIERRSLIQGQAPMAMVLGCADSRVPIEIVFDQGLGDVFVCRNAGNLLGDKVAGTIDYAIHHLGIKLVVVMGHQVRIILHTKKIRI
mmetsp:Transcript_26577/g.67331  ORF Transcript_26577/g.67331 Transcript_26577/m.67331 type:complete len:298 (-) Transcript_26577:157-1050(-)